jgi:integrase
MRYPNFDSPYPEFRAKIGLCAIRILTVHTPNFARKRGENAYRRILKQTGISRTDVAGRRPRLHDLRHAFAVHRLIAWYQEGKDVQQLLPQLSVYLGHRRLADTSTYLTMTPELLRHASQLFEQYALKGGSQ